MITEARFENFKCLANVKIDFTERLTVLVGANASGKTSVLQGLYLFSQLAQSSEVHGFNGALRSLLKTGTNEIRIACKSASQTIGRDVTGILSILDSETVRETGHGPIFGMAGGVFLITHDPTFDGTKSQFKPHEFLRSEVASTILYCPETRLLANPSYLSSPQPILERDGTGLASVLEYLKVSQEEVYEQIQDYTREVIPTFRRFRFRRVPVVHPETEFIQIGADRIERKTERSFIGSGLALEFANALEVEADQCSEGTMLAVGLITALLAPPQPSLLLLDDLDRGLHPRAQRKLVGVLRKILQQLPHLQIVATCHSPFLLDCLEPEEVRLMALDDQGASHCGRLSDHPDFARWKDEMEPGEIWSHFGEQWLATESK